MDIGLTQWENKHNAPPTDLHKYQRRLRKNKANRQITIFRRKKRDRSLSFSGWEAIYTLKFTDKNNVALLLYSGKYFPRSTLQENAHIVKKKQRQLHTFKDIMRNIKPAYKG
ncbi:MAG: hypothetical protein ACRC4K_15300 [Plesiomonas shigelloides]